MIVNIPVKAIPIHRIVHELLLHKRLSRFCTQYINARMEKTQHIKAAKLIQL
jgi:hypothetical protein